MEAITDLSQLDPNGIYSYADYLAWRFEQAIELIKGKILQMSGPNRKHQKISWQIGGQFFTALKGKQCEAYAAPFDVRLFDQQKSAKANKDILTVVQPDLCVICDLTKLDDKGCLGAPDLVVEILSLGNSRKEMHIKKMLYEENEVKEYWVVDSIRQTLAQFTLQENGLYDHPRIYVDHEVVQSARFDFLRVDLREVFEAEEENG